MAEKMPEKMFVCLFDMNPIFRETLDKYYAEGTPLSEEMTNIRRLHLEYMYDVSERGILWLGGPSSDLSFGMNIFAVNSLEEAQEAQRNDPLHVQGMTYNDRYFEWIIHMPLGKTSLAHREKFEKACRDLGIIKD